MKKKKKKQSQKKKHQMQKQRKTMSERKKQGDKDKKTNDMRPAGPMILTGEPNLGIPRAVLGPLLTQHLRVAPHHLDDRRWDILWMFRVAAENPLVLKGNIELIFFDADLSWGKEIPDEETAIVGTSLFATGMIYELQPTLYIGIAGVDETPTGPSTTLSRIVGPVAMHYREAFRGLSQGRRGFPA